MNAYSQLEQGIEILATYEEKLPRREREKLRQREEILACALDLFSENGFHNISMHEIAQKSEFAIGTLYKFFQNKEDLYKALVLDECSKLDAAFTKALEEPDNEIDKLRSYVRTQGEMLQTNFIRLFLAESRGISYSIKTGLDQELRNKYNSFLSKLAQVFESGIKNKRFREIASPYYLAVSLDNIIHAFLLLCLEDRDKHPFPKDPDTILNIFFNALLVR